MVHSTFDVLEKKIFCMQALQSKFGGWADDQIVPAFVKYAKVVFQALGGKSEYWTTFNEPINFCFLHYAAGNYPLFIKDVVRLQIFLPCTSVAWRCFILRQLIQIIPLRMQIIKPAITLAKIL